MTIAERREEVQDFQRWLRSLDWEEYPDVVQQCAQQTDDSLTELRMEIIEYEENGAHNE